MKSQALTESAKGERKMIFRGQNVAAVPRRIRAVKPLACKIFSNGFIFL